METKDIWATQEVRMKNVGNNSESGEEREVAEMEVNGEKIEKRRKSFLLRNETVGKEVSRK